MKRETKVHTGEELQEALRGQYLKLGISKPVYTFGEEILAQLENRFAEIDAVAEYNQLKVVKAMQEAKVSGCMHRCSILKTRWCVHRLPAGPMRWRWR